MEKHSPDSNKSAVPLLDLSHFLTCNGKRGPEYLKWVSDTVSKNRGHHVILKSPSGASLKIGTLEDTIYSEKRDEVKGWGKFYLPGVVTMHVVGEGAEYHGWVSRFVSDNKRRSFTLKKPAGAVLRIAALEDTIYRGKDDEVNGWGKFYLPEKVRMQVVGVVEGTSCSCEQLVLMTCEDKKLYAFDGEELHLVASGLERLGDKEIEYPASKSYYRGEPFQHMTEEDWAKVKKGAVGRALERDHQKLVNANKSAFLKSLQTPAHS